MTIPEKYRNGALAVLRHHGVHPNRVVAPRLSGLQCGRQLLYRRQDLIDLRCDYRPDHAELRMNDHADQSGCIWASCPVGRVGAGRVTLWREQQARCVSSAPKLCTCRFWRRKRGLEYSPHFCITYRRTGLSRHPHADVDGHAAHIVRELRRRGDTVSAPRDAAGNREQAEYETGRMTQTHTCFIGLRGSGQRYADNSCDCRWGRHRPVGDGRPPPVFRFAATSFGRRQRHRIPVGKSRQHLP
jgi:hypothetical protein